MESAVVVYIRGKGVSDYLWYRMEFENNTIRGVDGKKEEKRIKFKRVGQLFRNEGGYGGGWDIIGEEDIYWVGGFRDYGGEEYSDYYACLDVFKHNCSNPKPDSWVKVSPRKIPRQSPFVAAVSGGKKLCVVSGYEHHLPKPNPNDDDDTTITIMHRWNAYSCSKAGELYDPNTDSWTYLEAPMEPFRDYNSITAALALDKDQILFHCRASGTALYYNLDTKVYISDLDFFEYFPTSEPPEPLQGCKNLDILHMVCQNSRPALCFDTFYWFTYDLHLFAYDIELETWFRSPSLAEILYPLKAPTPTFPFLGYPAISILLGLPTGELLVIVQENDVSPDDARYLSLASLSVAREGQNSLKVSLLFFQPFSVDDPSFLLLDGKAMLKKTG